MKAAAAVLRTRREEFAALMEVEGVRLRSRIIAKDGVTIELLGFDEPGVTGDGSRRATLCSHLAAQFCLLRQPHLRSWSTASMLP